MNISPPLTQTLHVMMSIMSMNISPPLTQTLHVIDRCTIYIFMKMTVYKRNNISLKMYINVSIFIIVLDILKTIDIKCLVNNKITVWVDGWVLSTVLVC
jgi:hypothetical protein